MLGLFIASAGWLSVVAAHAGGSEDIAEFRRGIGISHAMAWARIESGPAGAFAFPPFADPANALRVHELQTVRRSGFDFVRLAVDPGPFLQFQGAQRDALDNILLDRVKLILAARLAVIVDFHPSDLQPKFTAAALTAGLDTPLYRAYLRMLERTAGLLGQLHSRKVALELMNEPPVSAKAWQPMLEAAFAAARRGSSDLVLVLDGGEQASAAALMAMRTAPFTQDHATLFSFHYYDPYQFTHQGASWNAPRYLADVPYPARARPIEDSLDASLAKITVEGLPEATKSSAYRDAQSRLESYWRSGFDAAAIAQSFAQITDWARSQGVERDRIILGEFGARKTELQLFGVRADERSQWFRDVRKQAEAFGFGWAAWTYRGGSFGLVANEAADDIEPGIAEALGLAQRPRADATSAGVTSRMKP